jgi:large subunit ribosomal protein L30
MATKKQNPTDEIATSLAEIEKTVKLTARAPKTAPRTAVRERPAAEKRTAATQLSIQLVKSGICAPVDQKLTLAGLGLRRIRQTVVRADTPSLRGMLLKVRHLVEVSAGKE